MTTWTMLRSEGLAGEHQRNARRSGRARAPGRYCRPPRMRMTPISRPTKSGPCVGKVPAEAGALLLGGERAGDRHHRHDDRRSGRAAWRCRASCCTRACWRSGRRRPSRCCRSPRRRRRGFRTGRAGRRCRGWRAPIGSMTDDGGEAEDRERQDQHRQHRELHLARLDLLAEIFRRAADHQAGDEDGEDREDEHAVEARADAARQRSRRAG